MLRLVGRSDRLGKDARCLSELVADHVGVHPQCDRGVSMAQASCHDMHRYTGKQQSRRVKVAEICSRAAGNRGKRGRDVRVVLFRLARPGQLARGQRASG